MTKRPEDEIDGEDDPSAAERPRRRRRPGGLRIPSDNVPRHTGAQPSAPVPEDPALAVSIAYAFGDDASQPRPRIEADLDEATVIGGRPGSITSPPLDDFDPDGRTRQMPALNLEALGLSLEIGDADDDGAGVTHVGPVATPSVTIAADDVEVDLDDDDADAGPDAHDRSADDDTGKEPAVVVAPPPPRLTVPAPGDGVVQSEHPRLHTVALSDDDLEELVDPSGSGPAARAAPRWFPTTVPPRPATIPPSVSVSGERTTIPMPVLVPGAVSAEVPSVVISFSTSDSGPVAASARSPAPITPPPPAYPVAPPAPAPVSPPPVHDALVTAPQPETLSDGWTMPEPEVSGVADAIPRAPTSLLEAIAEPVSTPADASDSGEILADELVDDEEHARALPVATVMAAPTLAPSAPIAPAPTAPPPAPVRPPPAPAVTRPPTPPVAARPAAAAAAEPDDGKKKRRGRPWFEEVFDEDYLRTLPYLTPAATQAEAQMVLESLALGAGASVLDLGCGYGRHAMELAARGLHVVGVDLSLPLLLRGADEAQRRGLDINFIHADMRDIDFDAQFDGAYCLFSTFGYFDDDTNKKVATHIGRALKPGGRLVLQVLNRDYVIGDLPTRVWWEGDGCVVLEEVDFNYFSSRVQSKRSLVFDDGRQVEQEISIRAYSLHELGKLFHAAGLRVVEVSGGMVHRGRFLGTRSREIIVIADRPDKP